jgi:polysaccharide export outer membrane protein
MDLWIVRREAGGKTWVLPVDWVGIRQRGLTTTNYQILDGDRLFLQARPPK